MFFSLNNSSRHLGLPIMAASVAIGLTVASPAEALELVSRYSVTTAEKDNLAKYNGGHTISRIENKAFVAESADGSSGLFWDVYDDGSVHFHGNVFQRDRNDDKNGWTVDVRFTELSNHLQNGGTPKIELKDEAYAVPAGFDLSTIDFDNLDFTNLPDELPDEIKGIIQANLSLGPDAIKAALAQYIASQPPSVPTGGPIDPFTWSFFEFDDDSLNTLTGFGDYAGRVLTIADITGGTFPVQVGVGANGKNGEYGMSTWFKMFENGELVAKDNGDPVMADFNVNLTQIPVPPTDVPTPAAGLAWLMTAGAAMNRKRKEEQGDES